MALVLAVVLLLIAELEPTKFRQLGVRTPAVLFFFFLWRLSWARLSGRVVFDARLLHQGLGWQAA